MCKAHPNLPRDELRQRQRDLSWGTRGFGVDSLESGLSKFHVIAAGKHLFIFTAGRFPFPFSISIFETNILMLHAEMTMKEEEEGQEEEKLYVLW